MQREAGAVMRSMTRDLLVCAATHLVSAAHIEASSVEVEVQDHDAGGGSQGAGLESQGGDLNDADQTKCMPCSLM